MSFPDICVTDRESCPNNWPVLQFQQQTVASQTITLREECGDPVDLSDYSKVCLLAKEAWGQTTFALNTQLTVVGSPEDGKVKASLDEVQTDTAGVLLGEFVLYQGQATSSTSSESSTSSSTTGATVPVRRARCYISVDESLVHTEGRPKGLTIPEIRMAIMDRCVEDNFLLDNVEFDDTQIAWAIRRPLDMWNDTPPPLNLHYTPSNFPYRYYWMNAVVGELLITASYNYERNRMRYAAANVSVDDKDKAPGYAQAGKQLLAEYKEWMMLTKRGINMERAMGTTSIPAFGS